jgi:hypothetical protein
MQEVADVIERHDDHDEAAQRIHRVEPRFHGRHYGRRIAGTALKNS